MPVHIVGLKIADLEKCRIVIEYDTRLEPFSYMRIEFYWKSFFLFSWWSDDTLVLEASREEDLPEIKKFLKSKGLIVKEVI